MTPRDPVFRRPTLSTVVIVGFAAVLWTLIFSPFVIMWIFAGPNQ